MSSNLFQYDSNRDGFVEIEHLKKLWEEQSGLLVNDFPQSVLDEILERYEIRHPSNGGVRLLKYASRTAFRDLEEQNGENILRIQERPFSSQERPFVTLRNVFSTGVIGIRMEKLIMRTSKE